jgi:hypothetical protein
MTGVLNFLTSMNGRILRGVVGIILIAIGLLAFGGLVRWILVIVGLVPLAAGIFDWCVFAPLFGRPFKGADLRRKARQKRQGTD